MVHQGAARQDLVLYLETFDHTVGVMQTKDALQRVAQECAEDLAADGVVYAEVRFAPSSTSSRGSRLDEVVDSVLEGFRQGTAGTRSRSARSSPPCATPRTPPRSPSWPCATATPAWSASTSPAARPATRPPATSTPSSSWRRRTSTSPSTPARPSGCRRSGRRCSSAERSGWATACASSTTSRSTTTGGPPCGRLASFVRDRRVPLEMCPTSNVNTGVCDSIAEHPIGLLARLRFRVTVNTDNRLMSGVSLTSEMAALVDAFGYGWDEIEWLTLNAMKSSFWPFDQRLSDHQPADQARLRPAPRRRDLSPQRPSRMARVVAEQPRRVAPASSIASAVAASRMPPLALMPRRPPTVACMSADSFERRTAGGVEAGGRLHVVGAGGLGDAARLDDSASVRQADSRITFSSDRPRPPAPRRCRRRRPATPRPSPSPRFTTMSSSVAPASTATSASWAFTAGWCAPLGNPITVAIPMPTPRPSVIGRCDGDTHTAATPRSVASSQSATRRRPWPRARAACDRSRARRAVDARSIGCHHARMQVTVVDHPLAAQLLTRLRETGTDRAGFRRAMDDLSGILVYEATRGIEVESIDIETPMGPTTGTRVSRPPLVVPVLRAGLGMLGGVLRHLPETDTGFIGVARNEETFVPEPYMNSVPEELDGPTGARARPDARHRRLARAQLPHPGRARRRARSPRCACWPPPRASRGSTRRGSCSRS